MMYTGVSQANFASLELNLDALGFNSDLIPSGC